jgi:hypothetical protein
MRRSLIAIVIVIVALAAAAGTACAQVIHGDVMDARTHAPVLGAFVVVYDSAGTRVAGVVADDSGRFAIRLAAPGHYRIRAERIGYSSTPPVLVALAAGATAVAHLYAPSVAVVLPTVAVLAESKCVVGPAEGEETAALWAEARKALYATELGASGAIYAVRRWFWRDLDGTSLIVRHDSARVDTVLLARPWATPVTPEQLARDGYAINKEGDSLAAPDAIVLLSEAFARTHCFHLRRDPEKAPGLIGLAFDPAKKRHEPEVSGVIWLDSATANLRYVEFRHTNLFPEVSPLRYGGRMDFEQLPSGEWVVRRWRIRLPVLGSSVMGPDGTADARNMGGSRHVALFRENGGELLSAMVVHAVPPP